MDKEWNDRQRRMVTNWMKATYEQFTERVMTHARTDQGHRSGRRGRIFIAKQALELGLVDEIGGSAPHRPRGKEGGLKEGQYELKLLPAANPSSISSPAPPAAPIPPKATPASPSSQPSPLRRFPTDGPAPLPARPTDAADSPDGDHGKRPGDAGDTVYDHSQMSDT